MRRRGDEETIRQSDREKVSGENRRLGFHPDTGRLFRQVLIIILIIILIPFPRRPVDGEGMSGENRRLGFYLIPSRHRAGYSPREQSAVMIGT